ncbi:MAG: AraC family transcriptional regulator [Candidatus Sumerlaeota bacterium]
MLMWHVNFHTSRPLGSLPRLLSAAGEVQTDPRYHHAGINRSRERHCLFKYSLRGSGVFRDKNGEHAVVAGSGFLCEIRDPETSYYYPPDGRGEWEFVYICFGGRPAMDLTREMIERYGPIYALPTTDPVIKRMQAFSRYDSAEREVQPSTGAAMVFDLLTTLNSEAEEARREDASNILVRRARSIISQSPEADLNATQVADRLGVSREHLTRVFSRETGATPYQYIVRQRMMTACRLLKETNLSVKEISSRLGYNDAAHFNRSFRRTVHMSPTEFRETGAMPVF